jgi:hypothetical protein
MREKIARSVVGLVMLALCGHGMSEVMAQSPLKPAARRETNNEMIQGARDKGIEAYRRHDNSEAATWFLRAAELGDAAAQAFLGSLYMEGDGVPQDYTEGLRWFRKAAAQEGSPIAPVAQSQIGFAFYRGHGVTKDDATAWAWFWTAARAGNPEAERVIGVFYLEGVVVKEDQAEGLQWLRKAAEKGDPKAKEIIAEIEKRLQTAAARWRETDETNPVTNVTSHTLTLQNRVGELDLVAMIACDTGGATSENIAYLTIVATTDDDKDVALNEVKFRRVLEPAASSSQTHWNNYDDAIELFSAVSLEDLGKTPQEAMMLHVCRHPLIKALSDLKDDRICTEGGRREMYAEDLGKIFQEDALFVEVRYTIGESKNARAVQSKFDFQGVLGLRSAFLKKCGLPEPVSKKAPASQAPSPAVVASPGKQRLPTASQSTSAIAFEEGRMDRQSFETWFAEISGDYREGASYWAGQRSLPKPGSCAAPNNVRRGDFTAGCLAAQQRLAAADQRRKTDPEYRRGWNSF